MAKTTRSTKAPLVLGRPKTGRAHIALMALLSGVLFGLILLISSRAAAPADADLNNDGKVDITDLSTLLSRWSTADAAADINGDGTVSITDLSILLSSWGPISTAPVYGDGPYDNPAFTFSGAWQASSGSGKYGEVDVYSSEAGASYAFTFSGRQVHVIASKAPHHGIAAVSIDGGAEQMVDFYAPTRTDQALIYSSPVLPAGRHTIKVRVTGTKNAASTGTVISADRIDVGTTSVKSPTEQPPASGFTTTTDEQFNTTQTLAFCSTGCHPTMFVEWHGLPPVSIGGGTARITGNSHTNSYNGYWRGFSRKRYGGVGKSTVLKARVRAAKIYTGQYNGSYAGVKLGLKFPQEQSVTGYSKEDPRSVIGGRGSKNPASTIAVMGVGTNGRMEVSRHPYGDNGYLPFPTPKHVGYTAGAWRDVTIRYDQLPGTKLRVRMWHTPGHDMSGTPLYEFNGTGVSDDKGFIWFRNDFSDFEYDYIKVEEKAL